MKRIFLFSLPLYFGFGLYLYFAQRSFIYFPVAETQTASQTRVFNNEDQRIKVSVLNKNRRKAILYFGGNAESVDTNAENFSALFVDYTVYLVKYRGYAGSMGTPTENAIYADAIHIYDVIEKEHETISLIGRSLGSAVATHVASKRNIDRLVLITPFDSIQNIAQSRFPIYPMKILLKDKHDSYSRVKDIRTKTLVIAAELDQVVEMPRTQRLLQGFNAPVKFVMIKGAGHNTISSHSLFSQTLKEFFSVKSI